MGNTYRIKDIAKMSGVSAGTVDRILHNRGKVSEEAYKKVNKVLKEIDYQPNLIARSLALKKSYRFIALIPLFAEGEYWAELCNGIDKARQELFSYNVEVERLYFDQYNQQSFDELIPILEQTDYQGVVIATSFYSSVMRLTQLLDQKKTPYVLIDAFIDKTNCIAYYGINSFDSGYIAGRLLYDQINKTDNIVIFRFTHKGDVQVTQEIKREEGFRNYLLEKDFGGNIYTLLLEANDPNKNTAILDNFFDKHKDINAGIIFNSKAHLVAQHFKQKLKQFFLIGYDVIKSNTIYLENGYISYLIAQRPEVQGFNCIRALFRHIILKEEVNRINYMPIDILIKENIKYYNNYI
ncbi:LacI family DNA-binding transcriptional regulator [Parabacteroides bouchesdurhonensis]|uniref:LacI family DNA-binding transcriptional regulator n=1 Tax=Parabacteroides bouchesdurhonensis TaxID=1936995 RepID=UPI000C817B2C|nr:LacI family DNA-binding transcriptional regulator [Parabacteroides bouchesdurhonensis]